MANRNDFEYCELCCELTEECTCDELDYYCEGCGEVEGNCTCDD